MGISTYILFNKDSGILVEKLLKDIEEVCLKNSLNFVIDFKKYNENGNLEYSWGGVNYTEEDNYNNLYMDIYSESTQRNYMILDWYDKKHIFYFAISIDGFDENTHLLLDFVFIILLKYPQAKVWIEENWFYTLEDLEKIKSKPFDEEWCYKNPKDL